MWSQPEFERCCIASSHDVVQGTGLCLILKPCKCNIELVNVRRTSQSQLDEMFLGLGPG